MTTGTTIFNNFAHPQLISVQHKAWGETNLLASLDVTYLYLYAMQHENEKKKSLTLYTLDLASNNIWLEITQLFQYWQLDSLFEPQ